MDAKPYRTCPKCGADAVHLASGFSLFVYGDQDDDLGEESKYMDEEIEVNLSVHVRVCYQCAHVWDAWIADSFDEEE